MGSYDAGSLARLFQINFSSSYHYQLPNPYHIRTGTELNPVPVVQGGRVYYSSGFLPSGAGQTTAGGTLLSSLGGALSAGLQTFLPSLFGGGGAIAKTPPILPAKGVSAPPTTPSGIAGAVQQHPIAAIGAAAGAAAATLGAGSMAIRSIMGTGVAHARYAPAGTRGYHMIKKGPHAGLWTRNRRRNVENIRALRRALSRAHGFERICRRVMHFTHPGKARGRAVFRRRRKRT